MRIFSTILLAVSLLFPALAFAQPDSISDCSISSLSGSSQSLAAAAQNRKSILIFNSGANNAYVNLAGGTAATSGASSVLIAPGASLTYSGQYVPITAITVIGTASQPIACFQGK